MANPEHLKILKQGVEVWNRWREENPDVKIDLIEANFRAVSFKDANLANVNLFQANFRDAYLYGVNLYGADLRGANLYRADLMQANLSTAKPLGANFQEADLYRACLANSDITGANFIRTMLVNTDFSGATIGNTTFVDVDLSKVKGLETVQHFGRSYIDIYTLERSRGEIPDLFLRGVGISDTFIAYKSSLISKAIQYYSCFIRYSSKDEAFAERLHADLQQKGVRCWFAPEDMKIGEKIRRTIDQSIRVHDKLLIILSENSMQSDWVEDEAETAIEEEKKRGETVLFPIRLDEAVMDTDQAWAAKLRRTRHIGDFSRWKDHDAYQQAFERLLRDLKSEG